jgi:hypothetical protein
MYPAMTMLTGLVGTVGELTSVGGCVVVDGIDVDSLLSDRLVSN